MNLGDEYYLPGDPTCWVLVWQSEGQAMETRRAETARLGREAMTARSALPMPPE